MARPFDDKLRALRRDRAARLGPELFLFERVLADCLERLALVRRRFEHALLIGCPNPDWPARLAAFANAVEVRDPGALLAHAAGGEVLIEDAWEPPLEAYDLVLAIGTLDTVNELPLALRLIRRATRADSLFIGAMSGGDTLPRLRGAMRAADSVTGVAAPHAHPRIEAAAVAPLLSGAGFIMPVVDVDRIRVAYRSMADLVRDLRAMGATNVLTQRSAPLSRETRDAAAGAFIDAGDGERTTETFEIVHFAAWTPPIG